MQKQKQMEVSPSTGKKKDGRQLQLWTGEGWQNTPIQECQGEAGYPSTGVRGRTRIKSHINTMFVDSIMPIFSSLKGLGVFRPRQLLISAGEEKTHIMN